jgi:hypothetical protein
MTNGLEIMVLNQMHQPMDNGLLIHLHQLPDHGLETFASPNPTLVLNHLHQPTDHGQEARASINRSSKLIMPEQTPERLWSLPFAIPPLSNFN